VEIKKKKKKKKKKLRPGLHHRGNKRMNVSSNAKVKLLARGKHGSLEGETLDGGWGEKCTVAIGTTARKGKREGLLWDTPMRDRRPAGCSADLGEQPNLTGSPGREKERTG